MYELFFEICRATLRITKWGDLLTKWAVAKWANYEVVGLSYEVGSCEVGDLRSGGVVLRSGQLRSGRITKWEKITKWAIFTKRCYTN